MKTIAQRFSNGVRVIPNGFRLVKDKKGLAKFIVIPLLINIVLLVTGLVWVTSEVSGIVESIMGGLEGWNETLYSILSWVISIGVWIAVTGGVILTLYLTSSVIASPFYSLLAERSLMSVGGLQEKPFAVGPWITTSIKMLLVSLGKAVVLLFITIAVFIASFIPVVNLVALFVTFILIAFDCSDYVLEAKEKGLASRFRFLKANLPEFSGVALFLGALSFIPGVIFLAIPFTIAGMADLVHQIGDES